MPSRTTTSFVTFQHPFVMAGYCDKLPAGTYEVTAQDEILRSLTFSVYRRTATHLLIRRAKGSVRTESRAIDHRDLALALAQDQACSKNLKQ